MRILVVEDERKVAGLTVRALWEDAYAVDIACNGEQALEMASENNYQLILLDVRFSGLSGVQVCSELRKLESSTPIMMLNARSLVEQRVEGLDAGADDYLTKPFAISELRARIRALMRRGLERSNSILRHASLELDRHRRRVKRAGLVIPLATKEFTLLEFLMLRPAGAGIAPNIS